MPPEDATLKLPKDLLESAIRDNVALAVASAMGDGSRILTEAVSRVLTQRVDSDGKPTNSSYGAVQTYVQWLVNTAIRKAVADCLVSEVGKHEEAIRAEIARQLSLKKSPLLKQLTDAMTTGVIRATENKWRFTVHIEE